MSWLLRFLAWASALAIPCWLLLPHYQKLLARAAAFLLGLAGVGVEIEEAQISAPFDLALFAAMCLATRRAPVAARARALALGLAALVAIEVTVVALSVAVALPFQSRPRALEAALRFSAALAETVPWVSAALVWLALLGRWELPGIPRDPTGARAGKRPRAVRRFATGPPRP